jgi:Fe2+ transport system protein FeoA
MTLATRPTQCEQTARRIATCPLAQCVPGSLATVIDLACSPEEGCRLRALGLYEGSRLCVVESRHCMLVDVRGTRLALGNGLTTGITVQLEPEPA